MTREVRAALALAFGRSVTDGSLSWPRVLAIAEKERCASLAWIRSSAQIRRLAPPGVVSRWRAAALAAMDVADLWEGVLARVVTALRTAGVDPIILKGLPLAERLYGSVAARPSADLDVFIPCDKRGVAHQALLDGGWRWRVGLAPREGAYETVHAGRSVLLEVHSSLLDDGIVRHLAFRAPQARAVQVGSVSALAHDDDQLPAFLATHLAKHAMPPMLWFVDIATLWDGLDRDERARAWSAARDARVQRYLKWALRRAADVQAAAAGDEAALSRVGVHDSGRRDVHNAFRVVALAATPLDGARAAMAWLIPPLARSSRSRVWNMLVGRLAKAARVRGTHRSYGLPEAAGIRGPRRAISVTGDELAQFLGEITGRSSSVAIRATGASMEPTIPSGATVRLVPLGGRNLRAGEVVVAKVAPGSYVLHRVARARGSSIRLRGDANFDSDPPVHQSDVCAVADAVLIGGDWAPIGARPLRSTLRLIKHRFRRLVGLDAYRPAGADRPPQ